MFDFLKKQAYPVKSTSEIIAQIHNEFDTASDRLLAEAKNIINQMDKSIEHNQANLEAIPDKDKAERLKRFGFNNSSVVTEKEQKEKNLKEQILEQNKIKEAKSRVAEALIYFSSKYPLYKFITIEEVEIICNKYNLVYGEVSLFKGFIPEKNLKDIENFKLQDEDYAFIYGPKPIYTGDRPAKDWLRLEDYNKLANENKDWSSIHYHTDKLINCKDDWSKKWHKAQLESLSNPCFTAEGLNILNKRMPLEIAAPIKDMNMTGKEVRNYKIVEKLMKREIPDPVVLQPCVWKGQKCYAIITAWGEEASDPIVVNNKMN